MQYLLWLLRRRFLLAMAADVAKWHGGLYLKAGGDNLATSAASASSGMGDVCGSGLGSFAGTSNRPGIVKDLEEVGVASSGFGIACSGIGVASSGMGDVCGSGLGSFAGTSNRPGIVKDRWADVEEDGWVVEAISVQQSEFEGSLSEASCQSRPALPPPPPLRPLLGEALRDGMQISVKTLLGKSIALDVEASEGAEFLLGEAVRDGMQISVFKCSVCVATLSV